MTFTPPGPGTWEQDTSHCPPAATPLYQRLASTTMTAAYRDVFAQWGGPLETMEVRFVDAKMYRRLVPLVGADRTGPPPPRPVLWLATRLHPAFRRRNRAALEMLSARPYLTEIDGWLGGERDVWIDRNRALQAIEPHALTDVELAGHLDLVGAHVYAGWDRHHHLHGSDMGPIGDLIAHTTTWGLDPVAVMELLRGASPATTEVRTHGRRIATALRAGGVDPSTITSLTDARVVPAAAEALDAYLDLYGWRVMTSYDVEGLTVNELPSATCALIRSCAELEAGDVEAPATDPAMLRQQVPSDHRDRFDQLLTDARRAYGVRDDNGPLTAEWPLGLARRAYLEAGRRLAEAGRLSDPAHVFELDIDEAADVLRGATAPSADDLAERASRRAEQARATAPARLGPALPPPDPSVFPRGTRRAMEIIVAAVSNLEPDPTVRRDDLHGLGIGAGTHRGTARVAIDPERVLDEMEPGDVLVAPWTAPTYNAVLAMAGAVVVQEGALLCHAAVMARELGIPAVVGCHRAMALIGDGDLIEVDAAAGAVTVVERRSGGGQPSFVRPRLRLRTPWAMRSSSSMSANRT